MESDGQHSPASNLPPGTLEFAHPYACIFPRPTFSEDLETMASSTFGIKTKEFRLSDWDLRPKIEDKPLCASEEFIGVINRIVVAIIFIVVVVVHIGACRIPECITNLRRVIIIVHCNADNASLNIEPSHGEANVNSKLIIPQLLSSIH